MPPSSSESASDLAAESVASATSSVPPANIAPMLRGLSAPLAAISTRHGRIANAQIAVAITTASIVPHRPRIIVQLYHTNYTCELVAASGILAVNFLAPDQLDLIWRLGMRSGRDADKLADLDYANGSTGSPILAGGFGYLDCRIVNAMDGGDLTAFLADVVDGSTRGVSPLYWRDARPRLPQRWADEWDRKIANEMAISEYNMLRP